MKFVPHKLTTPLGVAEMAFINEPLKSSQGYPTAFLLHLKVTDGKKFLEELREIQQLSLAAAKIENKNVKLADLPVEELDDGLLIKAKQKEELEIGGAVVKKDVKIVDSDGNPSTERVNKGARLKANLLAAPYVVNGKVGITLRLLAVKVTDFGSSSAGSALDFDDEIEL